MANISRPCPKCGKVQKVEYKLTPKDPGLGMKEAEVKLEKQIVECKHE